MCKKDNVLVKQTFVIHKVIRTSWSKLRLTNSDPLFFETFHLSFS